MKKSIIIVGSGWGGSSIASILDHSKYSVSLISPETTTPYTPLLASAACGLYDFSLVEIPIRHTDKHIKFVKATVVSIDFSTRQLTCQPAFSDLPVKQFSLGYDILVLAPGATNHTFGTKGAAENALFLRNVKDAQNLKSRVQDCFEKASVPGLSKEQQQSLLHFVIVGAGPTGIEVSSELSDLFRGNYAKLYPHLKDKVRVSVHDIADKILSGFDTKLQAYALRSFNNRGVEVHTGSHIEEVGKDFLITKEQGKIDAGLVVWATGNKSTPLVDSLSVKKTPRNPRILTDDFLRVFSSDSTILDGVFALGDAADIEDGRLPTTAEVACQKANYLGEMLNSGFQRRFEYKQTAVVAYLGQNDGVISGKRDYSGQQAWLAWRSKNFLWARTWRQRILIVITWLLDLVLGRSISPR